MKLYSYSWVFQAYLSSENKQAFYAKCGYSACEPVLNVGANTALFERFDSGRFFLLGSNESTSNVSRLFFSLGLHFHTEMTC